jgi:hypothetical protein
MIKRFHEAPKSIFNQVQKYTHGDYALVHLYEEDPEYLKMFKQALSEGREIILDNSIFELGSAFDAERFAYWIEQTTPTWYVIPDALEDANKTIQQAEEWNKKYSDLPGKKIGVVQGKTYDDIVKCYQYMDLFSEVDMIAISFDYSYYTEICPNPNKYISWMSGRVELINNLLKDGIINKSKPHHLLGNSLPQEGVYYRDYNWIYSMDTSNPVVHAIKNIEYSFAGLWSKESQKLVELINTPFEEINTYLVRYNIQLFEKFWNGSKSK